MTRRRQRCSCDQWKPMASRKGGLKRVCSDVIGRRCAGYLIWPVNEGFWEVEVWALGSDDKRHYGIGIAGSIKDARFVADKKMNILRHEVGK